VFYFTHLLYIAFLTLLIFHAPEFWKWVIAPLVIFVLEKLYRTLASLLGYGKSYITQATVLASRVTMLKIKRPDGFKYEPGDWVFIRIPQIAKSEWHPFTISSAPENREHVTLHIRGVGQWTNRLFDYVEAKKKEEGLIVRQNTVRNKVKNLKNEDRHNGHPVEQTNGKMHLDMTFSDARPIEQKQDPKDMMEVNFDGPFGAPATNIFRAEHAVLVATGIGVTPFSSILQSIMYRYLSARRECPRCNLRWLTDLGDAMQNLKKVDFIWINRDQKSFEWFLNLLTRIEADQQVDEEYSCNNHTGSGGNVSTGRFLDLHLYFTQALQRSDVRAVGMHLAMDLLHKKEGGKDIMTGLKSKTNAGRPNWDKIFQKLQDERKGKITVFYCGNPVVGSILRGKCEQYGFDFRKEVF
jgi:NAD(P)H-flavin reductase